MTRLERSLDRLGPKELPPAPPRKPKEPRWGPSCEAVVRRPETTRGFGPRPCGKASKERLRGLHLCGTHARFLRSQPSE